MMENYIVINGKKAELTKEQLEKLGIKIKVKNPCESVNNKEHYGYIVRGGRVFCDAEVMKDFNYLKEKRRMLDSLGRTGRGCDGVQCKKCPLGSSNNEHDCRCKEYETKYPEEATEIIRKWAEEHPQKTILQDFLEKYPNAPIDEGTPESICPYMLGYTTEPNTSCNCTDCTNCWNRLL